MRTAFAITSLTLSCSLALVLGACGDDQPADDDVGSESDSSSEGTGTTGTTDTTTTLDSESDSGSDSTGDEGCPPPDPPVGQTLEGEWLEVAEPAPGQICMLESGMGPDFDEGFFASEAGVPSRVGHLAVGGDGKVYAAGAVEDGGTAAWVGAIGQMNNNPSWARTWTYVDDPHPARGLAATDNDRLWFFAAPEHLFAVDYDGNLIDGPIQAFDPEIRYIDRLATGDGKLLLTVVNRPSPPNCIESLRMQLTNQVTGVGEGTTPQIFATQVAGLSRDGAGGGWQAIVDLNQAAATYSHYGSDAAQIAQWGTSNQAGYVLSSDIALAQNGDLIMALYSPGKVEVHRYDPDGNQLWLTEVADLGNDYGPPSLTLDAGDEAYVAFDIGDGFTLAAVQGDGTADWAGYWTCGAGAVDVHDIAVDGNLLWVGGEEVGGPGFIAQFGL